MYKSRIWETWNQWFAHDHIIRDKFYSKCCLLVLILILFHLITVPGTSQNSEKYLLDKLVCFYWCYFLPFPPLSKSGGGEGKIIYQCSCFCTIIIISNILNYFSMNILTSWQDQLLLFGKYDLCVNNIQGKDNKIFKRKLSMTCWHPAAVLNWCLPRTGVTWVTDINGQWVHIPQLGECTWWITLSKSISSKS